MQDFACPQCGQRLAFENSVSLSCGNAVAFDVATRRFSVIVEGDGRACANRVTAGCNWLAEPGQSAGRCRSCALTRTRPADDDRAAWPEFARAEAAKRRLILELLELGLPVSGQDTEPDHGVCFDLLSSSYEPVLTGHDMGVITLDLAEGDDVHREQLRISMDEPYRTLLGHFRHEIGHYYYTVLVEDGPARPAFVALFGDPEADYQEALDRHYSSGPPPDWPESYLSAYATMHPAEDWAETFAHYLHIRDTIDTAAAFGLAAPVAATGDVSELIAAWLPLSWALNMINRSMGHADLYPFIIPPAAIDKLRLVHELIAGSASQ